MTSELRDIIIPSIAFFVAFFLAYSLVEMLIILALNRLLFRAWGFTPEKLVQSRELYGKKIKIATFVVVVILLGLILKFTEFHTILAKATLEIKVLAAETLLAMILIYLTTTRPLTKLDVERSIHKTLYLYMSVIVFVLTIVAADRSYAAYKDFINANVTATIRGVERKVDDHEKSALINNFRKLVYQGKCPDINYSSQKGGSGVTQFVYLSTQDDLIQSKIPYEEDPDWTKDLRGRVCTNGVETFLLTDHGRWYWVVES